MMMDAQTRPAWREKTLLITDQNLGVYAHMLTRRHCADLTWLSWDRTSPESKNRLLDRIASEQWRLGISFYSDLVIPSDHLALMRVPVNIHPALPRVRGVGYDTIPLVENHAAYGATLHRMDEEIDAGEIFHVIEKPLGDDMTYSRLRRRNQVLCTHVLRLLLRCMRDCRSVDVLEHRLQEHGSRVLHRWSESYVSRNDLDHRLHCLQQSDPDHPVFS